MPDQPKPTTLELGLYAREEPSRRITGIEVGAGILTCVWLVAVIFLNTGEDEGNPGGFADGVLTILAILMPIALIWVAATAARTARGLREEAARLQASIDAMRAAYVDQQQRATMELRPAVVEKLEELVESTRAAQSGAPAVFSSLRVLPPPEDRAAVVQAVATPDQPQPGLAFATPVEKDPISVADFIKALNFPENEHDKEGFRTLRRALEDRATERLIRASQDVLTLLSQDGIYMDDLRPDRARPEIWRRFAQGERGRTIAALGGIHDRSSLVLAAGRMKKDPVFRDAAHHFLRHFDRTFMEFEKNASDAEIVAMAGTRTARAFMLIGRVAGTFD
ncbi:hypothetical protein [Roseicyclus mahoneyensis]|uniref:Uncharacterized protein n=1 Tax=Roseicyclus mahoneyensis TaxID=164332 RepID=A0A316GGR8_9RHOB|nr:hypothetical protein [Roseicyclus mahoneyensis]PWK60202.1 hypothetical protein C7455_105186 [Roseicyclus mahoneyensis]